MQTWRNRQELIQQTVALEAQGTTRRAIARALGISRNTVKKILEGQQQARSEPHTALTPPRSRLPKPTKLDAYRTQINELLAAYPEITAQRVYEEVNKSGYNGSYCAVKRWVRRIRPPARPKPSLQTPSYGPGEMAESDWSPHTVEFTTGERALVQVFDYVLTFSGRKCFRLYERADFFALLDGHTAAFERFGGVAHSCKYDSQKAVVLGWEGSQPIYNPRFLAFATHYAFQPRAVRRQHPNDKPFCERSFWEFERSFLNGRRFRDLNDMRAQLLQWERDVCDQRRTGGAHKPTRIERFAEEVSYLRTLPAHPYDTARVVYRLCSIEGFVAWDGNQYAVPYEHVTDFLPVRITQHELFVYAPDLRLIARHELAKRGAGLKLDPNGLHPRGPKIPAIDLEQLHRAYQDMGPEAEEFFAALSAHLGRLAGYHGRKILLLRQRYATDDLVAALRHAQQYDAYDHHAIGRILAARAAPRRLAEYVAEQLDVRLAQLGPDLTSPRDLDEYDHLPVSSSIETLETPCPSKTEQLAGATNPAASKNTSTSSL